MKTEAKQVRCFRTERSREASFRSETDPDQQAEGFLSDCFGSQLRKKRGMHAHIYVFT